MKNKHILSVLIFTVLLLLLSACTDNEGSGALTTNEIVTEAPATVVTTLPVATTSEPSSEPQEVCEHSFVDWSVTLESTCDKAGEKIRECSICGIKQTEAMPMIAHTPELDSCVPATCKQTGLSEGYHCSVCNKVIVEQSVLPITNEHSAVTDAAVPATCKSTGLTEGSHCSVCNKVLVEQIVLPMTNDHKRVVDKAVAATCRDTGLTEGSHCLICSKVLIPQRIIPITDIHTPVTDAAVPATCKDTGLTEGSHCSVCNKVFVAQAATPKTDHQYIDNVCQCGLCIDSEGLLFTKSGNYYILSGIGECSDPRIVVPAKYNGLSVIRVADDAFNSVSSFYEIILPSSITYIGERAFSGCKGLKTITIPSGVKYLERETFAGCTALEKVVLSDNVIQIMESCFASCTSLKNIKLSKGLLKIREYAFYNCKSLETISLPSSLNEIQQGAFLDCTSLYIKYLGMKWQFERISKGYAWSDNIATCFITCYDGEFDKALMR